MRRFYSLADAIATTQATLQSYGVEVDTGHWQGVPTAGKPDLVTKELLNWGFTCPTLDAYCYKRPDLISYADCVSIWQQNINPNLPWADDHFAERVSGNPSNPGQAYKSWPWWQGQDQLTLSRDGLFTHTYQERLWSRHKGVRYRHGDLDDLVELLNEEPYTRQAFIPIFFPEDTGAIHHGRIPCTLGYHFMLRNDKLHMWYFIRSCDFVRHFRDDIYLALRLCLWVIASVGWAHADVMPGDFTMVIPSLHYHKGDEHHLTS